MQKALLLCLLPLALVAANPEVAFSKRQKAQPVPVAESQKDQPQMPHKSPEEIQQELTAAEDQFERAKRLFPPWYTGPLITASPSMIPPGQVMFQPYVYIVDNYAHFNADRHSESLPSSLVQLKLQPIIAQIGVTNNMDATVIESGVLNWQDGQFGGGINDVTLQLGFLIFRQTPWIPQFKFNIAETFPTGKFKNLSTNGLQLNSTGAGAFTTAFTFTVGKVLFWATQHPVNSRISLAYSVSTPVHVTNFNAYGGGFGTNGTVHPGGAFSAEGGIEVSITERWVIATDIVYTNQNRSTFNGKPGHTATGAPASTGGGYSDNLSLAPAFEYNWSDSAGFIGGLWFSVYGRNSNNFVQGVLSVYIVLP